MVEFIAKNIGSIAVAVLLILIVAAIIRGMVKKRKNTGSCACCSCASCEKCNCNRGDFNSA